MREAGWSSAAPVGAVEAEIDAYLEGIRNRLWALALWYDSDRADERITDLVESLEAVREEVDSMTSED